MLTDLNWKELTEFGQEKFPFDDEELSIVFKLLSDREEITPRLLKIYPKLRVKVLFQDYSELSVSEVNFLNINNQTEPVKSLVREVILHDDETTIMFARTIVSPDSISKVKRLLETLNGKNIGKILFDKNNSFTKEKIFYQRLNADNWLFKKADIHNDSGKNSYWSRCSVFYDNGKPAILLTDVFFETIDI